MTHPDDWGKRRLAASRNFLSAILTGPAHGYTQRIMKMQTNFVNDLPSILYVVNIAHILIRPPPRTGWSIHPPPRGASAARPARARSTSFAVGSEKRYEKTSPTPSVTPIDRVTGKLVKASMPSPTRLVTKLALTTFHERPSRQDSSLWKIA